MDAQQWAEICARIWERWPDAKPWPSATSRTYFEDLRECSVFDVGKAVQEHYEDGMSRPPSGGQILKRLGKRANVLNPATATDEKRTSTGWNGITCECGEVPFDRCPSNGHPEGWAAAQRQRDQAVAIVEDAGPEWRQINPRDYPGYLGDAVAAMVLRAQYRHNWDAGRAIDDPGDGQGLPTRGKDAGRRVVRQETPPPPPTTPEEIARDAVERFERGEVPAEYISAQPPEIYAACVAEWRRRKSPAAAAS